MLEHVHDGLPMSKDAARQAGGEPLDAGHVFVRGLGPNAANHVPLTPVSFLERSAAVYPDKIAVRDGEAAYIALQYARLDVPARHGVAFPLVKKLLAFGSARVEVVVLSKNDPVSGLRVFRSAERAGLAGSVHFAGHQADVAPWLAAMDVFVHCAEAEPFGRCGRQAETSAKGSMTTALIEGTPGRARSLPPCGASSIAVSRRERGCWPTRCISARKSTARARSRSGAWAIASS